MTPVRVAEPALAGGALPLQAPAPVKAPPPTPAERRAWRDNVRLKRRWGLSYVLADVAMLGAAAAAAAVGARASAVAFSGVGWAATFIAVSVVALWLRGMYAYRLHAGPFDEVGPVLASTAVAAIVFLAARVLAGDGENAATQVVRLWAFSTAYLACGRAGMAVARGRASRQGEGISTLIIGAGQIGQLVAERLLDRPELGLRPIGFLDKEPMAAPADLPIPVLGASWDLEEMIERHRVGHVVIGFSTAPHDVLLRITRACRDRGVEVSLVPRLYEEVTHRVSVEHLGGIALLRVQQSDPRGWQFAVKYALDRPAALLMLIALSPLLAVIALLVRLSSPGPILHRQRRVGLDGCEFDMLKFRSMTGDPRVDGEADAGWASTALGNGEAGAAAAVRDRRTPIGRLLRKTSLDELPQLINVLRGDMSLVGPRPERSDYARAFERHVYRYGDRHRVKSGLTGWAQVHGLRGETSLADRAEWDNYYIENWSLWLDFKILCMTLPAVISARGAA